jgi:hypothetical protein
MAAPACTPLELVEWRDALGTLGSLPERQQRLLWLHAAGLSYAEMARHEGVTLRTVERQLLRGKRAARTLAGLGNARGRVAAPPGQPGRPHDRMATAAGRARACAAAAQPC